MKTAKRKKVELVRGEPVVEAVLSATIYELATNGYRALSIEQVALRAGVARTTVYRRWPTKSDLVRSAIDAMPGAGQTVPDGRDLRSKLIALGDRTVEFLATPHGLAVMRLFVADEGLEELRETMENIRRPRDAVLRKVLEDARVSGEVPPDADIEMLGELLPAALLTRAVVFARPIDRAFVARLVDFLLAALAGGAAHGERHPRAPSRDQAPAPRSAWESRARRAHRRR